MLKKSVNQVLKESIKPDENSTDKDYDFIYCAGLFDYLSDRICKKLMDYFYSLLAPGGLLVATNVDKSNPIRNGMESFLEWHLVYRDRKEFLALRPDEAPEGSCEVKADVTGVNIFMEVRKSLNG
jgi:extracellular factor (EF) 3-hydroxypalmitic acid methyl ester biosynthesis protein